MNGFLVFVVLGLFNFATFLTLGGGGGGGQRAGAGGSGEEPARGAAERQVGRRGHGDARRPGGGRNSGGALTATGIRRPGCGVGRPPLPSGHARRAVVAGGQTRDGVIEGRLSLKY